MTNLTILFEDFLGQSDADALAFARIDFESGTSESIEIEKKRANNGKLSFEKVKEPIYYDLASLTKPLTNGISALLRKNDLTEELKLLLSHRAGLPAWGLLSKNNWRETLRGHPVKESKTLYSDYSALRYMVDYETVFNSSLYQDIYDAKIWDSELFFWKNLKESHRTLQNGYKNKVENFKAVHDPNAYNLDCLTTHAGLFGTLSGVVRTLLNARAKLDFINTIQSEIKRSRAKTSQNTKDAERFILGWDTVADTQNTLAGNGCSEQTFGHLGFTGTSIWIDPTRLIGQIILTNSTKYYWHNRSALNNLRREVGSYIWY